MLALPVAAIALTGGATSVLPAQAADAPDFQLRGTPRLYTVANTGLGRPVAYVVFKGDRKLHEPRLLVADVAGHSGRTFLWRSRGDRCYRSSVVNNDANGKPTRFLTAGRRYRVRFNLRASLHGARHVIATRTLQARNLRPGTLPPGC